MTNMMRRRGRAIAGLAIGTAAMVALAGCTTGGTPEPSESGATGEGTGGTISIAQTNAATALNSATPDANLNTNGMVDYLMGNGTGPGSFFYVDNEFNVVPSEVNGTVELVSEDPLVVTYTLDPEAVWSDGTPMTTTDLLLSWAIQSGYYDDATFAGDGPRHDRVPGDRRRGRHADAHLRRALRGLEPRQPHHEARARVR